MDAKTQLLTFLTEHQPVDEKERQDLERMKQFAVRLADPLSRYQGEAHFTGSAVVIHP